MSDREKVIKGLELCTQGPAGCLKDCPYGEDIGCQNNLKEDALALLKEQKEEIRFLKAMQLRTVKGMDEGELGHMVHDTLRI